MKFSKLRGTGVALVTPFREDGNVDFTALGKLIDHVINNGIQNLVSLGTTGESSTLSEKERVDVIRFTIERADHRVPVIVGIGGNNTREVISQISRFPLDEVAAVLSVSPYYSKPSEEGLYQHYKAISEVSIKPIILYNVPGRTGRIIPSSVVIRLAEDFKNIVGIKDATGDINQCMQVVSGKPKDFMVVSGDDNLAMAQIACGAEGLISVAANWYADRICKLVDFAMAYNFKEAQRIQYDLLPLFKYLFQENNPGGIKAVLEINGMIQEKFRLPLVPVTEGLKEKIRTFNEDLLQP